MSAEDYYAHLDEVDAYANVGYTDGADEVEPWWERFYDERDDYDGYDNGEGDWR